MTGKMTDEDSELISIYYGAEVTEADAEEVSSRLEELYPDYDIGDQLWRTADLLLCDLCRISK